MKLPFFAAVQKFNALLAHFSALGLDLEKFLAIDAVALKARLDAVGLNLASLLSAEPAALKTSLAAFAPSTEPTAEQLASLFTAELTAAGLTPTAGQSAADCIKAALAAKDALANAATAKLGLFESAFATARIMPKASDEKVGVTSADMIKALNDRISIGAQEALAKRGLANFPTNPPGGGGGTPALQKTYEEFSALTDVEKMNFSVAGGRLTSGPQLQLPGRN